MNENAVNCLSARDKMRSYLKHPGSFVLMLLVMLAALVTFAVLIFLIIYILVNGLPYMKPSLFSLHYTSENASVIPALVNTVVMTLLSLLIAVPFGIFSAVFLVEYAGRGNKFIDVIRLTTETLSGIPSIVYGLFGMLFFVNALHWGFSILAGAFTLSIMILPLIMRTTEEALKSVPDSYREGSFGLGAGKLRTVFKIVLPSAVPGILAGVILAIGRIVGETAALIYTAGTVAQIPKNAFGSGRTLAVHMYMLSSEGLYMNQAYATAVILLILVVVINTLSGMIAKRLTKNREEKKDVEVKYQNLDLYYGDFKALKNVNLEIEANKITAFIGPSGCGKSTLLKSINRMNDLVEGCRINGEILLDGQNIFKGMDVNLLRKESEWFPEAKSISNEHL